MKAKLYILDDKMELKLSDDKGTFFTPKKNETQQEFTDRCQEIVENEFLEEFKLVIIDKEVVDSNDDDTLQKAFETAEGLQKKLIQSVLQDRGLLEKPKQPKPKVEKKKKEDVLKSDEYKEAENNINRTCKFSPFKSTEIHRGKIVGVSLSKNNTRIYYTVLCEDEKRRCCAVLNETLELDPFVKEEKEEKPKSKIKKQAKATDETSNSAAGDDLV